jgi:hypothetical protein
MPADYTVVAEQKEDNKTLVDKTTLKVTVQDSGDKSE